ncbi:MAG: class I SAM-dependent methyltransferase [Spirochaetia bacterium]|jgi:SAM-dependent methyltransferase
MSGEHAAGAPHDHDKRFHGGAERLRAPERLALMEIPRVVQLSAEGADILSVLDVGTGAGVFAQAFAERSLKVTGIDPNLELLEMARTGVPAAAFVEATAEVLPFADGSFDLVFLAHVLHETDDPEAALREARRVARTRVAILEWPYRREDKGPPLEHRLKPERIAQAAARAGFTAVERIELVHMDFYRMTP